MDYIKSFLKKYSALVLPAGLTLLAGILFIPTLLIGGKVKENMQQSIQQRTQMDTYLRNPPRQQRAELLKQSQSSDEQQALQIEKFSVETTRRELILYDLFEPERESSQMIFTNFGNRFRSSIENLIAERLRAQDAPTANEIAARTGHMQPAVGMGAGGMEGGMDYSRYAGGPTAPGSPTGASSNAMVDALCLARAEKIPVYAHPRVFPWYEYWGETYKFTGQPQALQDCWYSQTAYWIYEDVIATIEALNADSSRVATSPVKRLLGVRFQGPVTVDAPGTPVSGRPAYGGFGGSSTSSVDAPVYVTALNPGPFVSVPWTGRLGNEDLDVVHFAVSVVLDRRAVLPFYKELCSGKPHQYHEDFKAGNPLRSARHNQITILESTAFVVEKENPAHLYYRYGDSPVVQVDLVCEYLFYRKGYDEIKPDVIKTLLGQSEGMTDPSMTGMDPAMGMDPRMGM